MSMREIQDALAHWEQQGLKCAVALLFRADHSSPRPPGARLAMNEKGATVGAVSMGCVEADLRAHLEQVMREGRARIVQYGPADAPSLEVGLSCGGAIDVLAEPHRPDEVWREVQALEVRTRAVLVTCVSEPGLGARRLVLPDGRTVGSLGSAALDAAADRLAEEARRIGGTRRAEAAGAVLFAEAWREPAHILLVGASPIAVALTQLAHDIGLRVTVVDPRRDFAAPELFPMADRIIYQWPEEGLAEAGFNRDSVVAVLAHDAKLDVPALAAALRADCQYIGLLGSRRTQEQRRTALLEQGFSEEQVARIHGPIGLKIGAIESGEIAVSILAEIVAEQHRIERV